MIPLKFSIELLSAGPSFQHSNSNSKLLLGSMEYLEKSHRCSFGLIDELKVVFKTNNRIQKASLQVSSSLSTNFGNGIIFQRRVLLHRKYQHCCVFPFLFSSSTERALNSVEDSPRGFPRTQKETKSFLRREAPFRFFWQESDWEKNELEVLAFVKNGIIFIFDVNLGVFCSNSDFREAALQ